MNRQKDPHPGDIFIDQTDDYEAIIVTDVTPTHVSFVSVAKDLCTDKFKHLHETVTREYFAEAEVPDYYEVLYAREGYES